MLETSFFSSWLHYARIVTRFATRKTRNVPSMIVIICLVSIAGGFARPLTAAAQNRSAIKPFLLKVNVGQDFTCLKD